MNATAPLSRALYRGLLYLLPAPVRRQYGAEMVSLFGDRLRAADGIDRVGVWMRAAADLARHGAAEWRRSLSGDGEPGSGRRPQGLRRAGQAGGQAIRSFVRDLGYAGRTLAKAPGFFALVVLTLALGIGANTALFSVVHGVLLRPLPYPEPERLVFLQEVGEGGGSLTVSYPNFVDWRRQATGFSQMVGGFPAWERTVYGLEEPLRASVMGVSRGFFELFGADMALGRPFSDAEVASEGAAVVVSHGFWSQRLGANRNLDEIVLDFGGGQPAQVVGVTRPGFRFLDEVDVWYSFEPGSLIRNAHNHWVVARLADGIGFDAARDEMNAIAAAIKEAYPDESQAVGVQIMPLRDRIVGTSRLPLWTLMGAAALVLLVACTNVAGTLLARGTGRLPELAVRTALGAGRGRIVAQLLAESLLLAACAAAAGLVLAAGVLELLRVVAAGRVPRLEEVGIDPTVLVFCGVTAAFTAVLFGLVPALRLTYGGSETLASSARTARGITKSVLWRGFVAVEMALAVLLLVGAGLMLRSLLNIVTADTGFDRRGVVTAQFALPRARYGDGAERVSFLRRVGEQAAVVPGVSSAGLVNALPLATDFKTGPVVVPPYADPEDPEEWDAMIRWRIADAGYFDAMQIDVLRGRLFTAADVEGAADVAVVNRPLAERLWPGEDPVGKQVRALWDFRGADLTVVGVVAEARHWASDPGGQLQLYVPWEQRPEHADEMVLVLRTSVATAAISGSLRTAFADLDPDILVDVSTLDSRLRATLTDRNFILVVLGGFTATTLLLSLTGIYSVVSHSVARRRHEIGVRLALGAQPAAVRAMVQRHAMISAVLGAAIGCVAAAGLTRLLTGLLFEVSPADPLTFFVAAALLLAVALLASYLPARRSTRIDPVHTLRAQ